jgi:Fe-S-cluster containining protein
MEFYCKKCGLCCRNISGIEQLADFDNGGGICIHLQNNNLCDIYEHRPLVCNVDEMYKYVFAPILTWEEYVKSNTSVCDYLLETRFTQNAKI